MRLRVCADVHLGNMKSYAEPWSGSLNSRCRQSLSVFEEFVRTSRTNKTPMLVCGDLFDYANPEPQLVRRVRNMLVGSDLYGLIGNHDMHSRVAFDHALAALNCTAPEAPAALPLDTARRLVMLPFCPGIPCADYLRSQLALMPLSVTRNGVLAIHMGIAKASTPEFMLHREDDFIQIDDLFALMEKHEIDTCFAGNWHTPEAWSRVDAKGRQRVVVQCGALVPTGFDNPGLFYGMAWETDGPGVELTLINGPRFLTLQHNEPPVVAVVRALQHFDTMISFNEGKGWNLIRGLNHAAQAFANTLYVKVQAPPGADFAKLRAEAEQELRVLGVPVAYLGVVPGKPAQRREQVTATKAALEAGAGQAIERYLDKIALPDGVDRGRVLGRALAYLEKP